MEKSIKTKKESILNPVNNQEIDQTSEYDLLLNSIYAVPSGGHPSNDLIRLSTIHTKLKTAREAEEKDGDIMVNLDDEELAIIKQQISHMRWIVMSPVIVDFIKKFSV